MIITDEATQRSVARLAGNPDFKMFLQWLQDEKAGGLSEMLSTQNTVLLHQLQGSTRLLMDIERAVMLAPETVATINRRPNT